MNYAVIGYKKAWLNNDDKERKKTVIVKLGIPLNTMVFFGNEDGCRKNRASQAIVLEIQDLKGNKLKGITAFSDNDDEFIYAVGNEYKIEDFSTDFESCAEGIHFFLSQREAQRYGLN